MRRLANISPSPRGFRAIGEATAAPRNAAITVTVTVTVSLVFALFTALFIAHATPAFADEEPEEEDVSNIVDPTQRADNSFIYDTTIDSLVSQASLYENRTVQVVGEVVGDLISAGREGEGNEGREMCWIALTSTDSEDKSTISVFISADQAKQIDHFGRYGVVGTTLQVRGTYHQACAEHEGLSDIHSVESSPISRGSDYPDKLNLRSFIPGIVLIVIGAILMGIYYVARERLR